MIIFIIFIVIVLIFLFFLFGSFAQFGERTKSITISRTNREKILFAIKNERKRLNTARWTNLNQSEQLNLEAKNRMISKLDYLFDNSLKHNHATIKFTYSDATYLQELIKRDYPKSKGLNDKFNQLVSFFN